MSWVAITETKIVGYGPTPREAAADAIAKGYDNRQFALEPSLTVEQLRARRARRLARQPLHPSLLAQRVNPQVRP